jgi:hypothetical protein
MHTYYAVVQIKDIRVFIPFKTEYRLFSSDRQEVAEEIAKSMPGAKYMWSQEGDA